ncbi:dehydrogenase with different specificitie [Truncatella angustata]|uniref:Dehydrogenase with different specificitie n=1 Tax=Truncatella angustata TaxID=152316 RepID=A0A9P9A0U9_9PEZI|nr:dehydrogenase with different specificitie [Truncatella angustata]KAH6656481.1 dehydrogenase with different specificitie [Truncatella angustata]
MPTPNIWLITGATSGIGLELARAAISAGHTVIAGCRDKSKNTSVTSELEDRGATWLQLDVGADDIQSRIGEAVQKFGHIDVLVNNAGYALAGAIEDVSIDQVKDQFRVNVLGPFLIIQAILPSMRDRKSGTIVNISSGNGVAAMPGLGLYSASKFALEGLTECLQLELACFGIRVLLVEPGMIATRFADPKGSGVVVSISDPYKGTAADQTLGTILNAYAAGYGGSAEKSALRIVEAVDGTGLLEGKDIKLRLPLGSDVAQIIEQKGKECLGASVDLKSIWSSI